MCQPSDVTLLVVILLVYNQQPKESSEPHAKNLTLPQAAFIAGMPQSPFGYTPYTQQGELKENLEPGITRMKTVLKRMLDNQSITQDEYEKAVAYDITKDFIAKKDLPSEKYPWLTTEIEKRSIKILTKILAEKDGYEASDLEKDEELNEQYTALADRNLRQNGYKIYTTINKKIYDKMQKVTKNYPNFGYDKTEEVYDPETKTMKISQRACRSWCNFNRKQNRKNPKLCWRS